MSGRRYAFTASVEANTDYLEVRAMMHYMSSAFNTYWVSAMNAWEEFVSQGQPGETKQLEGVVAIGGLRYCISHGFVKQMEVKLDMVLERDFDKVELFDANEARARQQGRN